MGLGETLVTGGLLHRSKLRAPVGGWIWKRRRRRWPPLCANSVANEGTILKGLEHWRASQSYIGTDAKIPVGIHYHMAPSVRMEATPL